MIDAEAVVRAKAEADRGAAASTMSRFEAVKEGELKPTADFDAYGLRFRADRDYVVHCRTLRLAPQNQHFTYEAEIAGGAGGRQHLGGVEGNELGRVVQKDQEIRIQAWCMDALSGQKWRMSMRAYELPTTDEHRYYEVRAWTTGDNESEYTIAIELTVL